MNIINVSVADFKDEEVKHNNDVRESKTEKIKLAERQIINQILYQGDPKKTKLSKFKVKDPRSKKTIVLISGVLTILSVLFYTFIDDSLLYFVFERISSLKDIYFRINLTKLMFLTIGSFIFFMFVVPRISLKFTKLNFEGAESEFIENDNGDLLDQEAREIVYLLNASDVNTVIFEDFDIFKHQSIFIRLREINNLLNFNIKEQSNVVRFIYVIRDDIFESKERTKFFDFIIPIIPTITSKNSLGKIMEVFENIPNKNLLEDTHALMGISTYIDDMRLLYSIRNEYEIYSSIINKDLYSKELLGVLTLKNIKPKEFMQLEIGEGYLFELIKGFKQSLKQSL